MRFKMFSKLFFLLFISVAFIGCAQQKPMYYWGNYSDTLYHAKKEPGVETLAKHKEALENIVEESNNRNLRVPPGVYAELGYLYAAQNNSKKAIELFSLEKTTYPESTIFMDRLIMQTEKRDSGSSESPEDVLETEKKIGGNQND